MDISIIFPCYNEENSIGYLVKEALEWISKKGLVGEVLVGDNKSTDNSKIVAQKMGARIVPVAEKGYGCTVIGTSIKASGKYLIFADSDGQHDLTYLDAIYNSLCIGNDLVIGNRFHSKKRTFSTSWVKEFIGNPSLSAFGRFLTGCKINDFHSGFRGITRDCFNQIGLCAKGFELCSEMIALAVYSGFKVSEVPIGVNKPEGDRPSNIKPIKDGLLHLECLLYHALKKGKYTRVFFFYLLISCIFSVPYLLLHGTVVSPDTYSYSKWADKVIEKGLINGVFEFDYILNKLFYAGHILFVVICKMISFSHWQYVHFIFNIIAHAATGVLILFISFKLTSNINIAHISFIIFTLSIEVLAWTYFILSDTIFIFLLYFFFFLLFNDPSKRKIGSVFFIMVSIVTIFYRPTGILVVPVIFLFFLMNNPKIYRVVIRYFLNVFFFSFSCLLIINSYVLFAGDNLIKSIKPLFIRDKFLIDQKGAIIYDRIFYTYPTEHHMLNSLAFYLNKFFRFFQFVSPEYSLLHNIMSIIFYVPAICSIVYFIRNLKSYNRDVFVLIFFILLVWVFHTFTVIDNDWRYRAVLVPCLCFFIAKMIDDIIKLSNNDSKIH